MTLFNNSMIFFERGGEGFERFLDDDGRQFDDFLRTEGSRVLNFERFPPRRGKERRGGGKKMEGRERKRERMVEWMVAASEIPQDTTRQMSRRMQINPTTQPSKLCTYARMRQSLFRWLRLGRGLEVEVTVTAMATAAPVQPMQAEAPLPWMRPPWVRRCHDATAVYRATGCHCWPTRCTNDPRQDAHGLIVLLSSPRPRGRNLRSVGSFNPFVAISCSP